MLKQRILTAITLIPLVFISIFYTSPFVFRGILAVLLLLAAGEWSKLIPLVRNKERGGYLLLLVIFLYFSSLISPAIWIGVGITAWLVITVRMMMQHFISRSRSDEYITKNPWFVGSTGILFLTIVWVSLSFLHDQSPAWVMMLLLIVWIADIAAYFSGRRLGRHFLAPQISPKKTWEGAYGALLTVFATILMGGLATGLNGRLLTYFLSLGLIVVVVSIVGDLFESLLKRQTGTKDSGQLLPGHGGLLDRIDSLIAAAPFFAGGIFLLGWL